MSGVCTRCLRRPSRRYLRVAALLGVPLAGALFVCAIPPRAARAADAPAAADEQSAAADASSTAAKQAEAALAEQGLRRSVRNFVLNNEAELSKQLRDAAGQSRKVRDARRAAEKAEAAVDDKKKLEVSYLQKSRQLRAQLPAARTVEQHNAVVLALNELSDRITLLEKSDAEEKASREASAAAAKESEHYIEMLLAARKLVDDVNATYAKLATDPAVAAGVKAYNQAAEKQFTLGPSTSFLTSVRRLAALEGEILSGTVELRHGDGSVWMVSVMINGTHATEMTLDTGAGIVCLPWKLAAEAGLKPTEDSHPLQMQLADGSTVVGHRVVAASIRVGKFTAENVECAVMPEDLPGAQPLLGQTYLRNFVYKIDSDAGKLVMSRIEDDDKEKKKSPAPRRARTP